MAEQLLVEQLFGQLLGYDDLVKQGIVNNRSTLARWERDYGFPPGIRLGPHTRRWTPTEIIQWLETRRGATGTKG
jgi:CP4-57 regulatory protein AlpA